MRLRSFQLGPADTSHLDVFTTQRRLHVFTDSSKRYARVPSDESSDGPFLIGEWRRQ